MRLSARQQLQGAAENNRGISGHVRTLHQRLYHALKLGSWANREKWHCSDIEIQRLVLRSIDAFIDCINRETLHHPLVKDSVVDMVRALESILKFKSQSVMRLASSIAVKMVSILPSSMLQPHRVFDLICPLAELLASQQPQVAISCATALNIILSKLSSRQEKEVWEVLKETGVVGYLVHNVEQSFDGDKPVEYFQENASLLCKILWRWPSVRFGVWNDSKFLKVLDAAKLTSESSMKVAVLQLYSALALCGNAVDKLLENGEVLLKMMVRCMDCSNTDAMRLEAFKLARCLALSKSGCLKMMSVFCEPLVKAVIDAMRNVSLLRLDKTQISIVEEACRLASITRWAGDHHTYFWRRGVDRVLVDLLLDDYHSIGQLQRGLSEHDTLAVVHESLNSNSRYTLRPYVWDILGGLAANCAESFNHENVDEPRLKVLIMCACFSFTDSIGAPHQGTPNILTNMADSEAATRAFLMMVYSPCKYIASLAGSILSQILRTSAKDNVRCLLDTLNARLPVNKFGIPGNLQILVCLMSLACHCCLQKYRKLIIAQQGMKTMVAFIRWLLNNPIQMRRASLVPHLHDSLSERSCCLPSTEEWEGEDMLLFFSLWILAEMLHCSAQLKIHPSVNGADFTETRMIEELQDICRERTAPGSRWYAAHVLSYFGVFGFPSKLGRRIGKSFADSEYFDLKLSLANQDVVDVHEVILMVRCPSLLRRIEEDGRENAVRVVRLSDQVDKQSLLKVLQYIYSGYLQASDDLIRKLKTLAKHCKLETLVQMLSRRNPKWGTPVPSFGLTPALGPLGRDCSNLVLEANTIDVHWVCNNCSVLNPHLHVHKAILESSCDYLRGLFRSGMQESHVETIKVPVSWGSLNKLVEWFYSDHLPVPNFDCTWANLGLEEKFREVQQYIELCWLAEFWLIDDLHEECNTVVISCLNSSRILSTKIIQIAADFSQLKLAEVAANYMAPSYHNLRKSGELDELDENLVEMVRAASVRYFQEGGHDL